MKKAARRGRPAPTGYRWISKMEIRHYITKKMMRRKDGLPFRILVRDR